MRTLFQVPGARSSPKAPAIVTRPGIDRRVLELPMASLGGDEVPPIPLQQSNGLSDLHGRHPRGRVSRESRTVSSSAPGPSSRGPHHPGAGTRAGCTAALPERRPRSRAPGKGLRRRRAPAGQPSATLPGWTGERGLGIQRRQGIWKGGAGARGGVRDGEVRLPAARASSRVAGTRTRGGRKTWICSWTCPTCRTSATLRRLPCPTALGARRAPREGFRGLARQPPRARVAGAQPLAARPCAHRRVPRPGGAGGFRGSKAGLTWTR